MTREEAAILLGLPPEGASPPPGFERRVFHDAVRVRAAWAIGVKAAHADTAGTSDAERLGMLTMARDILLQTEPQACKQCAGVGKVRMRFGMVQCSGCKGTGDKCA